MRPFPKQIRLFARGFLFLWMLLAALLLGSADTALLRNADYFLLLPLLAFAGILVSKFRSPLSWFARENRADAIAALLFTVLTLVMLPLSSLLSGPMFSDASMRDALIWKYAWQRMLLLLWNSIGLLGAVLVSLFGCWYEAIRFFLHDDGQDALCAPEKPLFFGVYRETLPVFFVALVCVLSASPGVWDQADNGTIWNLVHSGMWNDWHPVTYLFFVRLCTLLFPTRRMISLVFLAGYTYASNTAIGLLNELSPASRVSRAGKRYAILTVVTFLPLLSLGGMGKDAAYAIALLNLALQLLRILLGQGRRGWRWVAVGVWAFCGLSFRHDGIIPIALTFLCLLVLALRERKRLAKPVLLTFLGVFAVHFLVTEVLAFRILHAERNPAHAAFGTPMLLLAAVADSGKPIDQEDQALMEIVMPVSDWAEGYNPYFVDSVARSWGAPGENINRVDTKLGIQYCRLTLKYLLRYPGVVLRAFLDADSLAWEITTPDDPRAKPYNESFDLDHLDEYGETRFLGFSLSGFSQFTYRYARFLETTPILREVLIRGGVPFLCLLFSCFVLWKKGRRAEILSCMPAFGTWLPTFFGLCAQDPRYLLSLRMWVPFIVVYAFACPVSEKPAA